MSILINNKEFLTRPCTFLIRFPPPFPPPPSNATNLSGEKNELACVVCCWYLGFDLKYKK